MSSPVGCRSGKVGYVDAEEAREALGQASAKRQATRSGGRSERRVYLCVHCSLWHLTSHRYKVGKRRGRPGGP